MNDDMNNDVNNGVSDGERYELRVAGHLGTRWANWFDGMTLTAQHDGTTVIAGRVADQSALHGLLHKLSDIGLTLISVTAMPADHTARSQPATRSLDEQSGSTS